MYIHMLKKTNNKKEDSTTLPTQEKKDSYNNQTEVPTATVKE